jgi:hypothetical protein
MGDRAGVYRILVGTPDGKRPLGRPRPRWENNIMEKKWDVEAWNGFVWLKTGRGGGRL